MIGFASVTFALEPNREITQYNCRTWTRQNGLPVNRINAVAQTPDGYIWMGTTGGLVRFNGRDFDLIELSRVSQARNTIVKSLAVSRDGGLWAALEYNAFAFYDGREFSFRGKEEWGGVGMNIRTILQGNDGSLWFASQSEPSRLTPEGKYESLAPLLGDSQVDISRVLKKA